MLLTQEAMSLCDRMKSETWWKIISQHGGSDENVFVEETKMSRTNIKALRIDFSQSITSMSEKCGREETEVVFEAFVLHACGSRTKNAKLLVWCYYVLYLVENLFYNLYTVGDICVFFLLLTI